MNFQDQLIKSHGYTVEKHMFTTPDDYWITLHRIRLKNSSTKIQNNKPVLLQHDLLGTSASFVANQPENSLGKRL